MLAESAVPVSNKVTERTPDVGKEACARFCQELNQLIQSSEKKLPPKTATAGMVTARQRINDKKKNWCGLRTEMLEKQATASNMLLNACSDLLKKEVFIGDLATEWRSSLLPEATFTQLLDFARSSFLLSLDTQPITSLVQEVKKAADLDAVARRALGQVFDDATLYNSHNDKMMAAELLACEAKLLYQLSLAETPARDGVVSCIRNLRLAGVREEVSLHPALFSAAYKILVSKQQ